MNNTYNRILNLVTNSDRTDEVSRERVGNAIVKRQETDLANTETAEEHGRQSNFHTLQGNTKKRKKSDKSKDTAMQTANTSRDQQTRVLKNMNNRRVTGAFTDPKDK
tara:strand:+ start:208 stop:528 length:321 start_codon:yes stop_codon:yes gene_type:complete